MSRPTITSFSLEPYFWIAYDALVALALRPHVDVAENVVKQYGLSASNINISSGAVAGAVETKNNRLYAVISIGGNPVYLDIHLSDIVSINGLRDGSGYVVYTIPRPAFALLDENDKAEYDRLQKMDYPFDEIGEDSPPPPPKTKNETKGNIVKADFGKKK